MNYRRLLELSLPTSGLAVALALASASDRSPLQPPRRDRTATYLGSEGCQMCHPSEYSTWHSSFHRTMTRRPEDVGWDGKSGPALPVKLDDGKFSFALTKEGSQIVARGPDLHLAAQQLYLAGEEARHSGADAPTNAAVERALERVPSTDKPIALVTGSHHYLAFWLAEGDERELRQLPFVYHLRERAWAPRSTAFLEPPDAPPHIATWNSNCIQCHVVAGQPQETEWRDEQGNLTVRYRSRVAELGIACEACHGPGRVHAEHYRNPLNRIARPAPESARLIDPSELDSTKSSAICGQCHAYFVPKDEPTFWETGYVTVYSPGDSLEASRQLLSADANASGGPRINRELSSVFWPDGTMRVGGREYAGLVASACYAAGDGERKLACSSCHSMHDSEPSDQLTRAAAIDADAPCKNCHEATAEHSGHAPNSIGTSCVNCHMPKISYALLGSIRSHRVTSPRPMDTSVPSACALCHMDRPLGWFDEATQGQAARTGPHSPPPAPGIGEGVRGALAGNAAERAIYAAALGSRETQLTIGRPLAAQLLGRLTQDPYHAVRRIAERGLTELGWDPDRRQPVLDDSSLDQLERDRDERPIVISE